MATTIYGRFTRTTLAGVNSVAFDMTTATGTGLQARFLNFVPVAGGQRVETKAVTVAAKASGDQSAAPIVPTGFYSERIASQVTISSNVTLKHDSRIFTSLDPYKVTFRFELSKIATSGDIETPIGILTEAAPISGDGTALYTTTIPVPAPVIMYPGERFVLRAFLDPAPDQTMLSSSGVTVGLSFGTSTSQTSQIQLVFAETITFTSNTTLLYPRNSSNVAIGNFVDLSATAPPTQTGSTAVVAAPASGTTGKLWTKTSGGVTFEALSPRFKYPYYFNAPDANTPAMFVSFYVNASSGSTVNAQWQVRAFHYRNGVETEIFRNSQNNNAELGLTSTAYDLSTADTRGSAYYLFVPTAFQPDDRIALRFFLLNWSGALGGPFAGGTATIKYDQGTVSSIPADYIQLYDLPVDPFKAEGDPATLPKVQDTIKTTGMGNG